MVKRKAASRKRKKTWYKILAPKEFNTAVIGETLADDSNALVGKTVSANLMSIFNDPRKQNVKAKFKVVSVSEGKALTEFFSYELLGSYLKRMIRKKRSRVDDSFVCETKEGVKLRIKPIALTRNKVQKSVLFGIRKLMKEEVVKECNSKTLGSFILEVVSIRLQKSLKGKLSKIHPIAFFDLRVIKRL